MSHWINRFCFILLFFTFCNVHAEEIIIAADEWLPFTGTTEQQPGYLIEIAKAIYEPLGIKVSYKVQPWERALHSVRTKAAHCVAGAYISDAPDLLFPKEPLGMDQNALYAKKGSTWRYENVESLKQIRLAVIGGYTYDQGPIDDYIVHSLDFNKVQIINGNGALAQNIQKVLADRADVVLETDVVFNLKAQELKVADQFEEVGRIGAANKIYIACDPVEKRYANLLDEGIKKLRANGELAKILSHYQMQDWQKP